MRLLLKPGVDLRKCSPQMALAAVAIAGVYERHGLPCVVTSGCEGSHKPTSRHYTGDALDFRPPDESKVAVFIGEIRHVLGGVASDNGTGQFDVVWEPAGTKGSTAPHLHVEFDPPAAQRAGEKAA